MLHIWQKLKKIIIIIIKESLLLSPSRSISSSSLPSCIIITRFLPGFVSYRQQLVTHPLPIQNLSLYTFLLHQQEHSLPPSHDGLSVKENKWWSILKWIWLYLTRKARGRILLVIKARKKYPLILVNGRSALCAVSVELSERRELQVPLSL